MCVCYTSNPNHYGLHELLFSNFSESPYSHSLSWIQDWIIFYVLFVCLLLILTPNKSLRVSIQLYIWPKFHRWFVIDWLIDWFLHSTNSFSRLLQGTSPFGEDNGGLGQRSVMVWLIFSMSYFSWCLHGVGGKAEAVKNSLEAFVADKLRSDSAINQNGRSYTCLPCTLQCAWHVSLSNKLLNKYMIIYSCLTYISPLPKLLTFQ